MTAAAARRSVDSLVAKSLPGEGKTAMRPAMGSKFGCLAPDIYVLQDHKRLPARFFARVSGALISLLG